MLYLTRVLDSVEYVEIKEVFRRANAKELEKVAMTAYEKAVHEGLEQGALKGRRDMVLRCLRARFPSADLELLRGRLEVVSDLDRLAECFDFALAATSLDEFLDHAALK